MDLDFIRNLILPPLRLSNLPFSPERARSTTGFPLTYSLRDLFFRAEQFCSHEFCSIAFPRDPLPTLIRSLVLFSFLSLPISISRILVWIYLNT